MLFNIYAICVVPGRQYPIETELLSSKNTMVYLTEEARHIRQFIIIMVHNVTLCMNPDLMFSFKKIDIFHRRYDICKPSR